MATTLMSKASARFGNLIQQISSLRDLEQKAGNEAYERALAGSRTVTVTLVALLLLSLSAALVAVVVTRREILVSIEAIRRATPGTGRQSRQPRG